MRKFLLMGIASLGISGCVTPGLPPGGGTGNPTVDQVIAVTQQVCSFAPTATTILEIFASGVPGLSTASAVANAICAAIGPKPAAMRRAAGPPSVAGVRVRGAYLDGRVLQ